MPTYLTKPAKILAWFAIFNGALVITYATPALLDLIAAQSWQAVGTALFLILGVASIVAGFYGLRAKPWAFWLLFIVFVFQCGEYYSETFFFSFMGPLTIKLGWGTYLPPSQFNLNILAIVVCASAARVAARLTASSTVNAQATAVAS